MKTINKNSSYKWGSLENMPKAFKKCDHSWRELDDGEKNGSPSTHECVYCGLEKDTAWEPPMYGYQIKIIEVCEGVTLEDIDIPE
jgi:hypothetical protein